MRRPSAGTASWSPPIPTAPSSSRCASRTKGGWRRPRRSALAARDREPNSEVARYRLAVIRRAQERFAEAVWSSKRRCVGRRTMPLAKEALTDARAALGIAT